MKIAIFPSLIAPVSHGTCFGGAEIAALALAEALADRGHHIALVGMRGSNGRGLEVIEAPHTPAFVPGETVAVSREPFASVLRALMGFDVVHTHFNDPGGLIALDTIEARAIATLHLSAVFPSTNAAVHETRNVRYVAPSAFAARSYGREITVIPNGVGGVPFWEGPRAGLAWAGRRVPEKGLLAAIEVAARAGMKLEIAGPGERVLPAAHLIDHGLLPRFEVARMFGRASATLVTSSVAEAHPLVAIESLFAGTPVVGFAVGGLPEIVDAATGVLAPSGDIEACARAVHVAKGLSNAACRARAEAHFAHGTMVDAYERLYRA